MKKKNKDVNIIGLNKEIRLVFEKIEKVRKLYNGADYEVTVTSGRDGIHMKNSRHYTGDAIDIRSTDMKLPEYTTRKIGEELGNNFDVLFENDHIHIEYDPKKNKPKQP